MSSRSPCKCNCHLSQWELLSRTVKVEKLSKLTNPWEVEELFSRYGKVEQCEMKLRSGKLETLVTFYSANDAQRTIADANAGANRGLVLHNRVLSVRTEETKITKTTVIDGGRKIDTLNNRCLAEIFLYLPIRDRIRIERVCKRWRAVSWASWSYDKYLTLGRSVWKILKSSTVIIDREKLCKVLRRCGSFLKEIQLPYIDAAIYPDALSDVVELCPNLQDIDIEMSAMPSNSVTLLGRNCHDIRRLSIGNIGGSDESALTELFKQLTKLTQLTVVGDFGGECLLHLPPTIRELDLEFCGELELDCLTRALSKLRNLSVLSFCHPASSPGRIGVMEALSRHCKRLKVLCVFYYRTTIARCPILMTDIANLQVLKLHFAIDDALLLELSKTYRNLIELDISSCQRINFDGIRALAALPKLEKLTIKEQFYREPAPQPWSKYEPSEIEKLPRISEFRSLKRFEFKCCDTLSPSEVCCLLESSPLLELVVLQRCEGHSEDMIEWLIAQTVASNSKVAFDVWNWSLG